MHLDLNLDKERPFDMDLDFPLGKRLVTAQDIEIKRSKSGRAIAFIEIEDVLTNKVFSFLFQMEPGYRYAFKTFVEALGVHRSEDGEYHFDTNNLLYTKFFANVIEETYMDKLTGENKTTKKITRCYPYLEDSENTIVEEIIPGDIPEEEEEKLPF